MIWTINLQNMFETPFSCFLSKKTGWNFDIWNFFSEKKSILAHIFRLVLWGKKRRA